jgi:hypothetical protein
MKIEPVAFIWSGREMVPLDRFRKLAERQYRAGTEYVLVDHKGRSEESHRHFHACVRKGFDNLPEQYGEKILSPEHLRKRCLVWEGYADHTEHLCANEEAMASMILMVRKMEPYAVMKQEGLLLHIWVPQSQDHASMGHKEFETSKQKVLERIASMCGISLEELTKNAKETT